MPQRNLAVELLRKLLSGEIKSRAKRNVVRPILRRNAGADDPKVPEPGHRDRADHRGADRLGERDADAGARGESLGLSEDEVAFYDALGTNDSAVKVLGEPTLKTIARELVATVRKNVTIDWTIRRERPAQLRVLVKRILRKYGYPPDKQEKATQTVLEQAEVLSEIWAVA